MSIKDLTAAIGRRGDLAVGDLHFTVDVRDVNPHHGVVDWLVEPVAGFGTQWVRSDRVTLHTTETAVADTVKAVSR